MSLNFPRSVSKFVIAQHTQMHTPESAVSQAAQVTPPLLCASLKDQRTSCPWMQRRRLGQRDPRCLGRGPLPPAAMS